jgi:hypothetical protein
LWKRPKGSERRHKLEITLPASFSSLAGSVPLPPRTMKFSRRGR